VLAAIPFDSEEEVIALANDTSYGLGSGVWTQNLGRAHRVARALHAGMTWTNCYAVTDPGVTMTGAKQSGYGVKGGPWHIDEYLLNKSIWMNIGA
jgi:aldehyde dehydrogenase (NAD+)